MLSLSYEIAKFKRGNLSLHQGQHPTENEFRLFWSSDAKQVLQHGLVQGHLNPFYLREHISAETRLWGQLSAVRIKAEKYWLFAFYYCHRVGFNRSGNCVWSNSSLIEQQQYSRCLFSQFISLNYSVNHGE